LKQAQFRHRIGALFHFVSHVRRAVRISRNFDFGRRSVILFGKDRPLVADGISRDGGAATGMLRREASGASLAAGGGAGSPIISGSAFGAHTCARWRSPLAQARQNGVFHLRGIVTDSALQRMLIMPIQARRIFQRRRIAPPEVSFPLRKLRRRLLLHLCLQPPGALNRL
jgi:hypothetical protein